MFSFWPHEKLMSLPSQGHCHTSMVFAVHVDSTSCIYIPVNGIKIVNGQSEFCVQCPMQVPQNTHELPPFIFVWLLYMFGKEHGATNGMSGLARIVPLHDGTRAPVLLRVSFGLDLRLMSGTVALLLVTQPSS